MIKRICKRCGSKFMCEPGKQSPICGRCLMAVYKENQANKAKAETMGTEFKPIVFSLESPKPVSPVKPVIHKAIEPKTKIVKSSKIEMTDERRTAIALKAWATRKANAARIQA